jgi:DNA-binding NarL/FixJ family response regulator
MIDIVIYDDNVPRRKMLTELMALDPELNCLAGFDHCSTVLEDMERLRPDVVLMDIEMPYVNGIEGVRLIKESFPDVKVIMQTVFDDDEKIFAAIQAGAEGYILKNTGADKLLQSIVEVHAGGAFMTPSVALKVMKFFNQAPDVGTDYNLTAKEKEVLTCLSDGMSYKMVADKMEIAYNTVNSHVKKIYQKLHVNSLGEAISMAIKHKIVRS